MEYVSVSNARSMGGVRLVLTVGYFGPWGQCVKKMLEYKGIAYTPVAQHAGQSDTSLIEWTGSRNAPVLISEDQPPLSRWLDMILFAEEYRPSPPLLPKASESRMQVIGIVNELAGEGGLGWCRRFMQFDEIASASALTNQELPSQTKMMMNQYKYSRKAAAEAPTRIADIMSMLSARLHSQRQNGSEFLVGTEPSAADIYWACFSNIIEPLADEICPLSVEERRAQTPDHPALLAAKDPILLQHRDHMFAKYLGPVTF